MSEKRLTPDDPSTIPVLFGPRDRHVKRLRNELGVEIVLRGDDLKISGPDDLLDPATEILEKLMSRVEQVGHLTEHDISLALGDFDEVPDVHSPEMTEEETDSEFDSFGKPVDLFEKSKKIRARTPGQARYLEAVEKHDLVFCSGPAGSGKTYLAVVMALNALRSGRVKKIVLVRPAVEAGEKIGFLPGDLLAKVNPFLRPLLDAMNDLVGSDASKRYMESDIVEVVPLAFMRGRTLNKTFMILDEAQNTTITQMKMFLTRMGERSKIIVTGDTTQVDLPNDVSCGLTDAMARLSNVRGVAAVKLTGADIVRHRLVRDIVKAYDWDDSGSR